MLKPPEERSPGPRQSRTGTLFKQCLPEHKEIEKGRAIYDPAINKAPKIWLTSFQAISKRTLKRRSLQKHLWRGRVMSVW